MVPVSPVGQVAEDEVSDNSAECVVCLSDVRDTLILPCRHLCLCNTCADTLRYQANNCPICRLRKGRGDWHHWDAGGITGMQVASHGGGLASPILGFLSPSSPAYSAGMPLLGNGVAF